MRISIALPLLALALLALMAIGPEPVALVSVLGLASIGALCLSMVTSYRSALHRIHAAGQRSRALASAVGSLATLAPLLIGLAGRATSPFASEGEEAEPGPNDGDAFTAPAGSGPANLPAMLRAPLGLVPSN